MTIPKPVILCILDGWGHRADRMANAPALADTPAFDQIMATCPHALLTTHGPDVGLPSGQMGNSEVGHTNIGAGRVVAMDLGQIDLAIEDGSFFQAPALTGFIAAMQASGGTAHLLGVMSDGGVHGHLAHMVAAARAITAAGVPVALHLITDGRDVAPKSAYGYLEDLLAALPAGVRLATLTGRYFALDRDNRWERVAEAAAVILRGQGLHAATAHAAITAGYERSETDEFITATALGFSQATTFAPASGSASSATCPGLMRMTASVPVRPRLWTQAGAPSGPRTRRQSLVSAITSTGMPLARQVQRMR